MATVSLLATVGDLAASQAAGGISALLPSGIILPYGGATPPTGWLFCNGQLVSRTSYAGLFSAIGTTHGSGDGSTTFHLPDLRGRFLRGTDTMNQNAVTGAATRDLDRATRTAANSGGNTGDAVGSVQANATKPNGLSISSGSSVSGSASSGGINHSHSFAHESLAALGGTGWTVVMGQTSGESITSNASAFNHTHPLSGTAAAQTISAGDSETRPLNANVNYIIKV